MSLNDNKFLQICLVDSDSVDSVVSLDKQSIASRRNTRSRHRTIAFHTASTTCTTFSTFYGFLQLRTKRRNCRRERKKRKRKHRRLEARECRSLWPASLSLIKAGIFDFAADMMHARQGVKCTRSAGSRVANCQRRAVSGINNSVSSSKKLSAARFNKFVK